MFVFGEGGGEGKVGIVPKGGHRPREWASAPHTPTPGEAAGERHPQFTTNSDHACPAHYPIGGLSGKSMASVCKRHASYTPSKTQPTPQLRFSRLVHEPSVPYGTLTLQSGTPTDEVRASNVQIIYTPRLLRKKICNFPSGMGPSTRP